MNVELSSPGSVPLAAAAGAIGYLFGSILFAIIVSRALHGVDVRELGSRNPGFTNVFRALGTRAGLLTLAGDMAKGAAAVAVARWALPALFGGDEMLLGGVAALGALAGHAWPIFFAFHGGKGVATAAGAFACLVPASTGVAALVWALALLAFRYMSLASILGALAFPVHLTWFARSAERATPLVVTAWLVAVAIVLRHRSNLARLLRGEERRFQVKKN